MITRAEAARRYGGITGSATPTLIPGAKPIGIGRIPPQIKGAAAYFGDRRVVPSRGMSVTQFRRFQAQKAAERRAAEIAKIKGFSAKAGALVKKADVDSARATAAYKRVEDANRKLERLEREVNTARLTGMTVRVQQLNRQIRDTAAIGKGAYWEGRAYSGAASRKFDKASEYIESKRAEFEREGIRVIEPKAVPYEMQIVGPEPGVTARGIDVPAMALPEEAGYVRRWRSPTEPYLSRERIEAAQRGEFEKAAMLSAGLALPIGGVGAFAASGWVGLGIFAAEIGAGYVAGEVVAKEAPPILKEAFPGRKEEVYQIGGEALGIAAFVGTAGLTRAALKGLPKLKPLKEIGAIEVVKKKGVKLKLPKKVEMKELGKFIEPAKPLQYEEQLLELGLKGRLPKLYEMKMPFPSAKIVKALPKKLPPKIELGGIVEIVKKKPLQYPEYLLELGLKRKLPKLYEMKMSLPRGITPPTITVQKLRPMKPLIYKPMVSIKPSPPTTAGLMKVKQIPIPKFVKEIEKIAVPKARPLTVSLDIPGGYMALAKGLPRFVQPPKPAVKVAFREPYEEFKAAAITIPKEMRVFAMPSKARFGTFIRVSPSQRKMAKDVERMVPKAAISLKAILKDVPKFKAKEAERMIVTPVKIPKRIERIKEIERIVKITKPIQIPRIITRMRLLTIPKITTEIYKFKEPKKPKKPRTPRYPIPFLTLPKWKKVSVPKMRMPAVFKLEVRRKGVWGPAMPGVFTEKTAKRLAQAFVGGTPLAAFKLKAAVGIPRAMPGLPAFKPWQYRKPIKKGKPVPGDIWIEKQAARIDTPGEIRGITMKGLEKLRMYPALRKRKKKRKTKRRKK